MRVGEADDALDRLQVVGGAELGQERHVAGLGRLALGVVEDHVLERLARRARARPAEGAGQAVDVEARSRRSGRRCRRGRCRRRSRR